MKKLLFLGLALALVVTVAPGVFAAAKVTVGGEANFGYDFAKKDYRGEEGADFSDLAVTVKGEVADNISFYGKIKSENLSEKGQFFTDEAHATLKLNPVSLKIGYYGFGFGGGKDLLDVPMGDLKSHVGIQAEVPLGEGLTGKVYIPLPGDKVVNDTEAGAFGLRLDYNKEIYGFGVIYGQSDWKKKDNIKDQNQNPISVYDCATAYTVTAYFKPIPDLKAYVDYSTLTADVIAGGEKENTAIILGAYYTPVDLPIEIRAEYDLDDENDIAKWYDHNPWALRFVYKINSNVKIEANRNRKSGTGKESAIKLNICF